MTEMNKFIDATRAIKSQVQRAGFKKGMQAMPINLAAEFMKRDIDIQSFKGNDHVA